MMKKAFNKHMKTKSSSGITRKAEDDLVPTGSPLNNSAPVGAALGVSTSFVMSAPTHNKRGTPRSQSLTDTVTVPAPTVDVTCPICYEQYSKQAPKIPRVLSCGHYFCEECLDLVCTASNHAIFCITCKQQTLIPTAGLSGLPVCNSILEAAALQKSNAANIPTSVTPPCTPVVSSGLNSASPPPSPAMATTQPLLSIDSTDTVSVVGTGHNVSAICEECKVRNATVYCYNCPGSLCTDCCNASHVSTLQQRHQRVPVQHVPKRRFYCKEHPSHSLDLYCQNEQTLVCPMCSVVGSHRGHNVCGIEEAASEMREKLGETLKESQETLSSLKDSYSSLCDLCATSESAIEKASLKIQDFFAQICKAAAEREAELLAEVVKQSEINTLRGQVDAVASDISSLKRVVAESRTLLTGTSDLELLWEKESLIEKLKMATTTQSTKPCLNKVPLVQLTDITQSIKGVGEIFMRLCSLNLGSGKDGALIVSSHIVLDSDRWYEFSSVTVTKTGILTAQAWDGTTKGNFQIRVLNTLKIEQGGVIHMTGKGYLGGGFVTESTQGVAFQGESTWGVGQQATEANGGGGGGGTAHPDHGTTGGGGGGHGVSGCNSELTSTAEDVIGGSGGLPYGTPDLSPPHMGAGGGSGHPFCADTTSQQQAENPQESENTLRGRGGCGGGILCICSTRIDNSGIIVCDGAPGEPATPQTFGSGGGGGAGGSIWIQTEVLHNDGLISCSGGEGGACGNPNTGLCGNGGMGACGRIRLDTLTTEGQGAVLPEPHTKKLA
ncbi:hypothetical protein Pelo_7715 [Pelomyxa schiedti]|nr:hypothetical protein Pelo_7715 [Pelomyxa schiedti]